MTKEWLKFEWSDCPVYLVLAPMRAWCEDFAALGYPLSKMALTYSKGTSCFYVIKKEYEEAGQAFFKSVRKNPAQMFNILKQVDKAATQIFKMGKKLKLVELSNLSNDNLVTHYQQLFKWDEILWRKGQIQNLLELHNSFLTDYVRRVIKKKFGDNKETEYFTIVTAPRYQSVAYVEQFDMLRLAKMVRRLGIKNPQAVYLLKQHADKYCWMSYGWVGPSISYSNFFSALKKSLSNKNISSTLLAKQRQRLTVIHKQKNILQKISLADRRLVELLRYLGESKSRRVDAHSLTCYWADKMLKEIGQRVGLSLRQMRMVSPFHIPGLFNKLHKELFDSEYLLVIYWYEKKHLIKLVGKKAEQYNKYLKKHLPKAKLADSFNGQLAYPGLVKGLVRLVLSAKDMKKFRKGEILVTRMTDPSYLPIMRLASAFVTDVGGITCHAAIVARELKKPCLIGTKVATSILKNGDKVEVDAINGLVKKL